VKALVELDVNEKSLIAGTLSAVWAVRHSEWDTLAEARSLIETMYDALGDVGIQRLCAKLESSLQADIDHYESTGGDAA
jgi:hypothetical protein